MTINAKHASVVENKILSKLVDRARSLGYQMALNDGEEWTIERTPLSDLTDEKLSEALASTGADRLRFYTVTGEVIGSVWLIYGNDEDLISDYTDKDDMETFLRPVMDDEPT